MYRMEEDQIHLFDITLEDTFKLNPNNRWVLRAKTVPWKMAEEKYSHMFHKNGRPAKQIRIALGSLLIKEYMQCSDEEVVQAIMENPYLQYFIGLKKYTTEAPFDPSLMVWFRKRLSKKFMAQINEEICKAKAAPKPEEIEPPKDDDDEPHGGTLIVDATCAPADIRYPTDTSLLAESIEKTDAMIDTMQEPLKGEVPRPRTYRKKSRKLFTSFIKRRKPGSKLIRSTKRKQLGYLKRNLSVIERMKKDGGGLSEKEEKTLEAIQTLHMQQQTMYQNKATRIDDRIVSISQAHIRPVVRGKTRTPVEFGPKINMSVVNGYVFVDEINFNAFYEGDLLENSIINYYVRFGVLPSKILADSAYTSRDNRALCKSLGIKLMAKPLGRPPKGTTSGIDKDDSSSRNEVEGKFGTLKTRYGWNRIMARLPETGITAINMAALAFNLDKRAKALLRFFTEWIFFVKYRYVVAG